MKTARVTVLDAREPLIRALNLVGDGWSFLILRAAFFRVRRYGDFRETLAITPTRLSERLGDLVDGGLLERVPYQDQPPRHEYRLSRMGLDLYGMILMMMAWGDRWRAGGTVVLPLSHRPCGSPLHAHLVCGACDTIATLDNVRATLERVAATRSSLLNIRRQLSADAIDRGSQRDSVAATLKVAGDQWLIMILYEAFLGAKRFDEFRERTGIARNTLSLRLTHLVDEHILRKRRYSDKPARYEYLLTESGQDLFAALDCLVAWGSHWLFDGNQPATTFVHEPCTKPLQPVVVCGACKAPVDPRDIELG